MIRAASISYLSPFLVAVFAGAFGKDPDFFAFYRSMQAYQSALQSGDTRLLLSPTSKFFQYFNDSAGGTAGGAAFEVPEGLPDLPEIVPAPEAEELGNSALDAAPAARADFELPRVLSRQIDEPGRREAVHLQKERRLVHARRVREDLPPHRGQLVEHADLGLERLVVPIVRLVAVGQEEVLEPPVVTRPSMSTMSLTATGMPCSGPSARPAPRASSAAAAAARASSP